jgi:dynein light chain LC8-type
VCKREISSHSRKTKMTAIGTEAVIKISAVSPDVEQDCVDCASYALFEKKLTEQTAIAQFIKRELDRKYGSVWHVIVGRDFASYVSHDDRNFLYFFVGTCGFLLWRTNSHPSKIVELPPRMD